MALALKVTDVASLMASVGFLHSIGLNTLFSVRLFSHLEKGRAAVLCFCLTLTPFLPLQRWRRCVEYQEKHVNHVPGRPLSGCTQ